MRYDCLIIDHDDTAVDSTREVHHPAHVQAMQRLRPDRRPADLETWFEKNFDPGLTRYLLEDIGLSPEEFEVAQDIWREFTSRATPRFYPGLLEVLAEFQNRGGHLVVVSHSEEGVIRAHYEASAGRFGVRPDLVFGWDVEPEKRKPNPHPVFETIRQLGLGASEVLVIDDLKPGIDMALSAGVDAAAAFWSHEIPRIRSFMKRNCVATFSTVGEFGAFLFGSRVPSS